MLELKSKNLFIKSGFSSTHSISKVLDFYDLIGKNILLLHHESSHTTRFLQNSNLSSWVRFNKKSFTHASLDKVLTENLFRVDLLVVDFNDVLHIEESYEKIRNITDIPVIFIANDNLIKDEKAIKVTNFDTAYLLYKSRGIPTGIVTSLDSDGLSNFLVESIKDGWKSNLQELKKQYIRHQNLKDLLGDSE
jgi:hypothetical protein